MADDGLDHILKRGVAEIVEERELRDLLSQNRPLRLKMGFDPSRPDIHLGHVVGLRKLRQFQEMGHQVILIVGDWTAQIGDPSGQSLTRPMLTAQEVKANAETYMQQFFKVVDRRKTQAMWQSEWFGKFDLADVIKLTSRFTVAQLLAREDFANRFDAKRPIALTELLYPLLQAYDSVAVQADVEFGGTDQRFNLLMGRQLQAMVGQHPQQCFTMPILVGTDGRQKMSKSLGNYIGVAEHPNDMYGKIMSIHDELTLDYFELLTDVSDQELQEIRRLLGDRSENPMQLKKRLAMEIVAQFHGPAQAQKAEAHFQRVVQQQETPEEVREVSLDWLLEAISSRSRTEAARHFSLPAASVLFYGGLAKSRSEARRLIQQRAVEIDGKPVPPDVEELQIRPGSVIKVGKRRFLRITDAGKADKQEPHDVPHN